MPTAKQFKMKGIYLIDNHKPNYKKIMEELFLNYVKDHIQEKSKNIKSNN